MRQVQLRNVHSASGHPGPLQGLFVPVQERPRVPGSHDDCRVRSWFCVLSAARAADDESGRVVGQASGKACLFFRCESQVRQAAFT